MPRARSRPHSVESRRTRSTSSTRPNLDRIHSAKAYDDHHVYSPGLDQNRPLPYTLDSPTGEPHVDRQTSQESYEDVEETTEAPEGDVEKNGATLEKKTSTKDPDLVSWDGPDDPAHPQNWSSSRKWIATVVVSCFTMISPISSSMLAPALPAMSREFGITSQFESVLTLSVFVLGYCFGPLITAPMSEVFGRVKVIQLSNLFFLAWTLGCAWATSKNEMIVFRLLSGIGGAAPLSIGGGVISDTFSADNRGKAISIYSFAPLIGPAIGPVAGAWIAEKTTWRWVFWAIAIADAVIAVSGFFFLQETYAPTLLGRKAQRLRAETGNDRLHTEYDDPSRTLATVIRIALTRPFRLLFTQPIIQVIALYQAYLYGLLYIFLASFPNLWTGRYGESVGIGGLNYISLGLGFTLGTQITAPMTDRVYRRLKRNNGGVGRPEFRIPLMYVASPLIPIGLFIYGWTAQARTHWIGPNIGALLMAAGSVVNFQCMQTYVIDSYTRYAASGIAAAVVSRSLAGFGFPLFAPALYDKLDYGWGTSVLAFAGIGVGLPAPFLFWFYGAKLRSMSRYAAG